MAITVNVELSLSLKQLQSGKTREAIRRAVGGAVAEIATVVAKEAKAQAPRDTGRLAGSIRARSSRSGPRITAKVTSSVSYAAAIESGTSGKAPSVRRLGAWVRRKGIKPRRRQGRKPTRGQRAIEQVAFLIAQQQRRTKGKRFARNALEDKLPRIKQIMRQRMRNVGGRGR